MGLFDKLLGRKSADAPQDAPQPAPPAAPEADDWQQQSTPQEVHASEVEAMLAGPNPPVLLDVREAPELAAKGFIPGSVHIPMSQIAGRVGELPKDRPIVVYCASGMRSFDVGFLLIEHGCRDVSNLNGGLKAWKGDIARG